MLRSIAKWYISRSIDCNRAMPAWVERRLKHDPALKTFHNNALRLEARLRSAEFNASTSQSAMNLPSIAPAKPAATNRKVGQFAALAIGIAAVVLLALSPLLYRPTSAVNEIAVEEPVLVPSVESPDAARVRDMLANGRKLFKDFNQRATSVVASESEVEQLVVLADLDVDQVIQPVRDLGTSFGGLLSELDRHTEAENRRLISEGIGAWRFLVHKLPQSAASLAGL